MERAMNFSLSILGLIIITFFALLPLGIFANSLDMQHFLPVKLGISIVVALISSKLYANYAKDLKLYSVAWGFGLVVMFGMSLVVIFILVDVLLKVLGLE
jgi:hypothetical protein